MCTMPNNPATPNFIQIKPPEVMLASTLHFWFNWTFVKQVLARQLQMRPSSVCTLTLEYDRAMQNIMLRQALCSSHHSTNTCCHMMQVTKDVPCTFLCLSPNSPE